MMTHKRIPFYLILFFAVLGLTMQSCKDKGEDPAPATLVGTWVSEKLKYTVYRNDRVEYEEEQETDEIVFRFNSDLTGEMVSEDEPFTYIEARPSLFLTFTDPGGTETQEHLTINSITATSLVLVYEQTTQTQSDVIRETQEFTLRKQQ